MTTNGLQSRNFDILADKVSSLHNEKCELEELVSRFKNGNRNYLKIRGIAKQIVNRLLSEQGALLTSAIIAVVQALRVNPDKYTIIFDNRTTSSFFPIQKINYLMDISII